MTTKRVAVRLAAEGGRQVRAEFDGVGDSGERAFKRIETQADVTGRVMRRVMGVLGTAISVRAIVNYADTWSDLQARVARATGSQEQGIAVMERLGAMARRTYSSLEQTADAWLKNATALRELGMSTRESLDFTEALNNAMVVSGAKAERAEQLTNALSQATALGALRGTQLNTVIMIGGRLAELLAAELGVNVNQLRALGQQGMITGEVIRRALVGNLQLLREEADAMPATIGDAFILLDNAALQLVGTWDQLLGASAGVAQAMIYLADNLDRVASYAIVLAAFMGGRWVAAFVAARLATLKLAAALALLRGAIIRTGLGILIVAAGELVYWFGQLVRATGGFAEAMALMGELGRTVFVGLLNVLDAWRDGFKAMAEDIRSVWTGLMAFLAETWASFVTMIAPTFNAVADKIGANFQLDALGAEAQASMLRHRQSNLAANADRLREREQAKLDSAFDGVTAVMDRLRTVMEGTSEAAVDAFSEVTGAVDDTGGALGRAGGAGNQAGKDIKEGAEEALAGWDAVIAKLEEYVETALDWGQGLGDALVSAFRSGEEAFANFVKSGKFDFRGMITDMIADFARLAARTYIFGPLAQALGGGLGGAFGGLGLGGAGALAGIRSNDGGGHTGYGARVGGLDGKGGMLQLVHPRERIVDETRERRRGPQPVYVTINTPDVNGFARSRAQVQADIARALQAGHRGL
jgi:tape measure domain-containing protein